MLRYARSAARIVHVGKRGGCASTPQAFIHKLMVAEARRGERVVRLKGGDPFVFGRGGEECDALRAAGIEVEVVSGLTAGIAGPAAIGVPVTDRRYAPRRGAGHRPCARRRRRRPDWHALARSGLTLVIYMGIARCGRSPQRAARGGHGRRHAGRGHLQRRTCRSSARRCARWTTVADTVRRDDLASPAVLVVGDVVQAAPLWQQRWPEAAARAASSLPGG